MNYHTTTVTVKYNDEEYDVKVRIPYEVSTRLESRGEHFGTPCNEDMQEVLWDISGWEFITSNDCPLAPRTMDQLITRAISEGIANGSISLS